MPTLPELVTRILSTPPAEIAYEPTPGNHAPVVLSLVNEYEGADADPGPAKKSPPLVILPPVNKAPVTPAPPLTVKAPVEELVEAVAFVIAAVPALVRPPVRVVKPVTPSVVPTVAAFVTARPVPAPVSETSEANDEPPPTSAA